MGTRRLKMTDKITNLNEVKAKLYEMFNISAARGVAAYEHLAPERIASGTLAQAIAAVEGEQRESQAPFFVKIASGPK